MRPGAEFEALMAAEGPSLLRAAVLLTGDRGLAEDLVQSTIAKAYLSWSRVAAADSPAAYLRRVLINTHRGTFRRRRVSEHLTPDPPEGTGHRTDDRADADLRRDVVAAVRSLPRRQRAVVVLRYLEDRSDADVAAILGCSVGTVRSQASRALRTLRDHPALAATDSTYAEEAVR